VKFNHYILKYQQDPLRVWLHGYTEATKRAVLYTVCQKNANFETVYI